ncbi:MAG: hypothetical protein PW792_04800 [Acidobacteriaceae bacterium]|nr:hypothetical protein [Acidobacteriaceae bacterium]
MTNKRIIGLVVIVLLVIIGYYYWRTTSQSTALGSGEVTSSDGDLSSSAKSKMDSGAVNLDGRPSSSGYSDSGYSSAPKAPAAQPAPIATPISTPAAAPANNLPTEDTLNTNAPNGMAFGGSGIFQWYRQGNLTWRINTKSGSMCVAFATMDEWAKPLVYTHGCGNA